MAKTPVIQQCIDEVVFFINYLRTNIEKYDLHELTNGGTGDIPNIIGAHPLAVEYGNYLNPDGDGNYTSILPAIGVELIDDNDNNQQYLGSGYKTFEITQEWIDEADGIALKDRFDQGLVLSNANLDQIKADKVSKGSEKLYATSNEYLLAQNVNISCWSDHWQITRILYVVLRGLLEKLKHELSKNGVRNTSLSGQGALYNYEFDQTLFGAEFNLRFTNGHRDTEVDPSIGTIKKVDMSKLGEEGKSKVKFKGIGEQ
jgi:hypothetical protein